MSQIADQVHNQFKVFAGNLDANNMIGPLADQVANFVQETGAAAKSIGVEYLEAADRLIITLGYRSDEPGYPIKLSCVSLGQINALGSDFIELEKKMQEASAEQRNIICHELYVTSEQEFLMIFMTHQA
jgi:hypothetical protein